MAKQTRPQPRCVTFRIEWNTISESTSSIPKLLLLNGTSRETTTEEFKTMLRTVEAVLKKFPGMQRDVALANKDSAPLISKIRKVHGLTCMHAIAATWIYARDYY